MVFFQDIDLTQIKSFSDINKKYRITFLNSRANAKVQLLSKITTKFLATESLIKKIGTGFRGKILFKQIEVYYKENARRSDI